MKKIFSFLLMTILTGNTWAGGLVPRPNCAQKPANTSTDHYWNAYSTRTDVPEHDKKLKMFEGIPDSTPLKEITILGTHDSGSVGTKLNWRFSLTQGWSVTQTLDITGQLELGVRYFDIRLDKNSGELTIAHGVIPFNYDYKSIIKEIRLFLQNNPTEFVILNVRANNDYFSEINTIDNAEAILYPHEVPSFNYGSSKGKIIRLNCTSGCGAAYWAFEIQDNWEISNQYDIFNKKLPAVIEHAKKSNINTRKYNSIYLNYLSAAGATVLPSNVAGGRMFYTNPNRVNLDIDTACSRNSWGETDLPREGHLCLGPRWNCDINSAGINEMFARRIFENNTWGYLGVIIADFPGPKLAEAVRLVNSRGPALKMNRAVNSRRKSLL